MTPKPLTTPDGYKTLVRKIARELEEIEFFVKRKTAQGYWNIGKYIHEYVLKHQERAKYGENIYQRLTNDIDTDIRTLQRCVQFYRVYPITAAPPQLTEEKFLNQELLDEHLALGY